MSFHTEPSEDIQFEDPQQTRLSGAALVKALSMRVPETVLRHDAEKKRVKKGILSDSEEQKIFEKTLYLPYLDFTYHYPTEKGFLSKQSVVGQGRSVVLALREADFGFYPELTALVPQLSDILSASTSIIPGVDSTLLVKERLEDLKQVLSYYDAELQELSNHYNSLPKTDATRQDIKDNIDHLRGVRATRWKMFADGLKLPSKVDLDKIELLEGNLFYIPYFMVKFSRSRESRFLVWDREGKENDPLAEELTKNNKFRELVQSHAGLD